MSSPINLSGLPVAGATSPNNLMLIRQGLTDYQIALSIIQSINLSSLTTVPAGYANSTDLMYIYRNGAGYSIPFSSVGLPKGTCLWFYNSSVPVGWSVVPNTGNMLLAVSDGTNQYGSSTISPVSAGNQGGTWQQEGWALSVDQMPAHQHGSPGYVSGSGVLRPLGEKSSLVSSAFLPTFTTGGNGSGTNASNPTTPDFSLPTTNPHNHGNTWRPACNVGIIGIKNL